MTTITIMKLLWNQVTLRALLLLGSVAAMEKGGGDIGSSDRGSAIWIVMMLMTLAHKTK
jgi:hypothetical protein